MSPLSISVYISKTMDIIQVLIAYKLQITNRCQHYKGVSTVYTSKQVLCVKYQRTVLNGLIFDIAYGS